MLKKQVSNYEEELKKEKNKYVNITYQKRLFIFHWSVCLSAIRSSLLKEEMKVLKEKEDKETKALEDLVQKVEKNLATATVSTI